MILSQFGRNKHKQNFFKDEQNLQPLKKITSANLFHTAQEKSCDYLLIIYMKKFPDEFIVINQKKCTCVMK